MKSIISLFLCILFIFSIKSNSQTIGGIIGQVIDGKTGEVIIGANIKVEGTILGASSDIEGKFFIKKIPVGEYTITISCVSYTTKQITKIKVSANLNTEVNIALTPSTLTTAEVLITGKASTEFESALLNQKKKSINISDGISIEQIKKSTDVTTADALRRVSGVTLFDNKFVYVRGISERYSNAFLNNSTLASTEPDKKSFAFDLIPSNLIENTVIIKSFTPDNPGDYSGGLIKVNTVDFPTSSFFSINYSTGYVSDVSTKNFFTYQGGKYDYLGLDDGTRNLPENFPEDITKYDLKKDSLYLFAKTLKNNWKVKNGKAPINQSLSLTYADKFSLLENDLGIISSLSYRNSFSTNSILRREIVNDGSYKFDYSGTQATSNVIWGALLNLSYKILDFHKISYKNSFTVNGDDEVVQLEGIQTDKTNDQKTTSLRFVSRQIFNSQISGESYFSEILGSKLEWRFSYSKSIRNEPDYRRYTYARNMGTNDPYYVLLGPQTTLALGGRYFSDLKENVRNVGVDYSLPTGNINIKLGGNYETKDRAFTSRLIGIVTQNYTDFRLYYWAIDSVFAEKNYKTKGFAIGEYVNGTNNYTANQVVSAGYIMAELPFILFDSEFRFIGGVRLENNILRLRTLDYSMKHPINVNQNNHDLLPSINFIYRINDFSNLRLSYSQTINRPEFREIAPFTYYDFQTQTSVNGSDSLKCASIRNYDFRFEIFPRTAELLSLSFFYKRFVNAIEKVVTSGGQEDTRTFANAELAKNYGFEIELRTSFDYISNLLSDFSINANYTWVKSEITETSSGINRKKRPLQGQSPFVINIMLNYSNVDFGSSITLQYNKIGKRIIEVANYYNDDIYEESRDLIDFIITQKIFENLEGKFSIKDFLGEYQNFRLGDVLIRSNSKKTSYSLGLSYKL
jgi:hypothetical protein